MYLLALSWGHYFFAISLTLLSIFMVLVILVQRGRGGGLTGALGGMGGQSAFGTKAGDLFTRITIVVAALWVLLAMAALKFLNPLGVSGYDPSLRGQAAPPAKTTSGGLLPSATKSGELSPGKSNETATPAPATTAAPATTEAPAAPATKAESPTSDAKTGDSAKP
jgi:preprotein translocase subunit SecG